MENINKLSHDLYEKLLVRAKKFDEDSATVKSQKEKNASDAKVNQAKKKELDEREKPIKEIEDVIALREETATAYQKFVSEKKVLKKDQAKFEEYKKAEEAKLKTGREDLSSKNIKLKKAQQALSKEKADYKIEVVDSLAKQGLKLGK